MLKGSCHARDRRLGEIKANNKQNDLDNIVESEKLFILITVSQKFPEKQREC